MVYERVAYEWAMKHLIYSLGYFLIYSVLLGFLYPFGVELVGRQYFKEQAEGSIVMRSDQAVGSMLIGQNFTEAWYFWGRPSATSPRPYNASSSSGSNLALTNPKFSAGLLERVVALSSSEAIPVALVTASASGLDPEISIAAAKLQVPRIASARGLDESVIRKIVRTSIKDRALRFFGHPRVNVLELNLELDRIQNLDSRAEGSTE